MKPKQLPSGSWRVQVQKDGKRYSFTSKDKETAKENARTFLKVKADVTAMPLGDAIDSYIELKRNVLSPSTIKGYEQIRQAYLPELMKIPIQELNSIVMQRAINVISANHSPKTVRNIYGLISSVIKLYAPALSFAVRLPQKRRVVYNLPTTQEVAQMVAESFTEDLRTAILLAAFCGLRRGEIIALTSDDIIGDTIHVNKAAVYDSEGNTVIKTPKTYCSDRYVTVPDVVKEHLAGKVDKICPIGLSTLTRQFVTLRKRLGLSCRFHDLRHYYASFQHAIGVPDQYIMQSGGWQSDAILKSVYRNTLGDMKRKNDELINSFLNTHISPEKCTRLHTNGTSEDNKKPQKPSIYKDSTAFIIHGRNGARTRD